MLVCQDGQPTPQGVIDANGQAHVAIFKGMMVVTFQIFVADQRQPDMSRTPDDFATSIEV